jgi:hypothetical protein
MALLARPSLPQALEGAPGISQNGQNRKFLAVTSPETTTWETHSARNCQVQNAKQKSVEAGPQSLLHLIAASLLLPRLAGRLAHRGGDDRLGRETLHVRPEEASSDVRQNPLSEQAKKEPPGACRPGCGLLSFAVPRAERVNSGYGNDSRQAGPSDPKRPARQGLPTGGFGPESWVRRALRLIPSELNGLAAGDRNRAATPNSFRLR